MYLSINMRSANAYKTVGAEAGILGADAHQLIGLIFDAVLKSLRDAKAALQVGDVLAKAQAISRATRLIDEGLRSVLNDAGGGEIAANLSSLYDYSLQKLVEANIRSDVALVEEVEKLFLPVVSAWREIRPQVMGSGMNNPSQGRA
jgi:flagellar protein FliS